MLIGGIWGVCCRGVYGLVGCAICVSMRLVYRVYGLTLIERATFTLRVVVAVFAGFAYNIIDYITFLEEAEFLCTALVLRVTSCINSLNQRSFRVRRPGKI